MARRGGKLLGAIALAAMAGCNAVTGVGELEFTRDPGASSGSGGGGGSGSSGAGAASGASFGDAANDYPAALLAAPGGEVVLTGTFAGTVDFGAGPVMSGGFQHDAFVARFDPAGALRSVTTFDSGGYDCAFDSAIDPSGRVLTITGVGDQYSCSPMAPFNGFSPGFSSPYISRYSLRSLGPDDVAGPEITLCDPCDPMAIGLQALATDPAGGIYVAGGFSGTSTVLGTTMTATGDEEAVAMKLDAAGVGQWTQRFATTDGRANITDMVIDAQGGVIVAGLFVGTLPVGMTTLQTPPNVFAAAFLARLDAATGEPTWARSFNDAFAYAPPRLAATGDGVLMTGDFLGVANFGGADLVNQDPSLYQSDAYLAKFDVAGGHLWSVRFGEPSGPLQESQGATAIGLDPNGDLLLVGGFGGSIELGGQVFEAGGTRDGFLARLSATGEVLSARQVRGATGTLQSDFVVLPQPGAGLMAGSFLGEITFGGPEPLTSKVPSSGFYDLYSLDMQLP